MVGWLVGGDSQAEMTMRTTTGMLSQLDVQGPQRIIGVAFWGRANQESSQFEELGKNWLNWVGSMIETELIECYKYIFQCVLNVHLQCCLSATILGTEIHMTGMAYGVILNGKGTNNIVSFW